MKKDNEDVLLIGGAAALAYFLFFKKPATVVPVTATSASPVKATVTVSPVTSVVTAVTKAIKDITGGSTTTVTTDPNFQQVIVKNVDSGTIVDDPTNDCPECDNMAGIGAAAPVNASVKKTNVDAPITAIVQSFVKPGAVVKATPSATSSVVVKAATTPVTAPASKAATVVTKQAATTTKAVTSPSVKTTTTAKTSTPTGTATANKPAVTPAPVKTTNTPSASVKTPVTNALRTFKFTQAYNGATYTCCCSTPNAVITGMLLGF